jgi:hypothetical protein
MIITPARATGPTTDNLFPSAPRPAHLSTAAVFPSYFAGEIQICRESLLSHVSGDNAAELFFTSQLSLPPLARRVA